MSYTIYKYPLLSSTGGVFSLSMPDGAQVLHVAVQPGYGNQPMLWALHDNSRPYRNYNFVVYGTGWDLPARPGVHVATWQSPDGYVWHLFQLP